MAGGLIDRVVAAKSRSIDRCLARVREEYVGHEATFATNYTRQDAAILNLLRACEQAIDMANRVVRLRKLELADEAAAVFGVLEKAGLLDRALAETMKAMVGFRNLTVHAYEEIDIERVRGIIEHRLGDLEAFRDAMIRAVSEPPPPP